MSEDSAPYTANSFAGQPDDGDPEIDYYRRKLRQFQVWLKYLADPPEPILGVPSPLISSPMEVQVKIGAIRVELDAMLKRPRSNGAVIDRMELELAELRAKLVDADYFTMKMRQEQQASRELDRRVESLRKQVRHLTQNMGPVERTLYRAAHGAAVRVDDLLRKVRDRWI